MKPLKDIVAPALAGVGITIGVGTTIYAITAMSEAKKMPTSPWRCDLDGLRFPSESALIAHIIERHRPAPPNNPKVDTPPAPMVFLHALPFSPVVGGLTLWRIIIDRYIDENIPVFRMEQLGKWDKAPQWVISWCGVGKIELATSLAGPWLKRGVTCAPEERFPAGGFTIPGSLTVDWYLRIPELKLEPILLWKGVKKETVE